MKKYSQFSKLKVIPKVKKKIDEGAGEYLSEEEEKKYMQRAVELPLERKSYLRIAESLLNLVEEILYFCEDKINKVERF